MADYNSPKRIDQLETIPEVTGDSLFLVGDPDTGKLHKIKKSDLDFSQGFSLDFLIADWSVSGGYYILDIVHSLNSESLVVEIRKDGKIVEVDSIENVDADTIRLSVPADPNLRFDGTVSVVRAV
jgi:hypothetical protein